MTRRRLWSKRPLTLTPAATRNQPSLRLRPALEQLEGRCLLSTSSLVYPGPDGNLIYQPDARDNRIPDFSLVGYQTGIVPLPDTPGGVSVPIQVTLDPSSGDQAARIQAAINQVSQLPPDGNGFRGAVLLTAGEYPISGQLHINASGVVLEGVGSDPTSGTRLRATGTSQRTLIQVTGSGSRSTVSGTTHNLIDNYVPVGATSFTVDSTANLHVGDTVIVHRPSPANWIHDIGMDQLINPWQPNSRNLDFDRVITNIDGNTITLDAPLTNSFEQQYGGGTIYRYTWSGRLENVGVENFYAVSDSAGSSDQNHATGAAQMDKVENAWVENVISQGFAQNVYVLGGGVKWATLDNVQSLDTSITTGAPPSGFLTSAQLTLIQNAYVHNGYHAIAVGPQAPGPNVYVNVAADGRGAGVGPHQRWSTGGLLDNVIIQGTQIQVVNAGNSGTGHGWEGANYVVWNSYSDRSVDIQNPPTAQNWAIGDTGARMTGNGIFDSWGAPIDNPPSLYYQQLSERLANPGLSVREYRLCDNDNYHPGDAADFPYVDPDWYTTVQNRAGSTALVGFDDLRTAHKWVPFSFTFNLAPGEQVIGATLSVEIRRTGSVVEDDLIYLNSLNNGYRFDALGWTPLPTTSGAGRVLDLGSTMDLSQLQAGLLNVAIQDDTAVDWAALDLKVIQTGGAPGVPGSMEPSVNRSSQEIGTALSSAARASVSATTPPPAGGLTSSELLAGLGNQDQASAALASEPGVSSHSDALTQTEPGDEGLHARARTTALALVRAIAGELSDLDPSFRTV